jgi:D-alanyl-D-alanine carboxypeptidase (penicillin-binding protein 5/6)
MQTPHKKELSTEQIAALALLLLLLVSVVAMVSLYMMRPLRVPHPAGTVTVETPLDRVEITAQSAVVYDLLRGVTLYEKDARSPRPLASITKVMASLTALSEASPDTMVPISPSAIAVQGDSGLAPGDRLSLRDMIEMSLIESSNDAAAALLAVSAIQERSEEEPRTEDLIALMNRKAAGIGMVGAMFRNSTGLDEDGQSGGTASAYDAARLMGYALNSYPEIFSLSALPEAFVIAESGTQYRIQNTNRALASIPNVLASKTGFTDLAGGNLAVIFDAGIGRQFAVVVLGSTEEGRFEDVASLVNATLESLPYSKYDTRNDSR